MISYDAKTDYLNKGRYYIQRGSFRNEPTKKGIDSILSFDYMGAAEFEFGSLPKSLTYIRGYSKSIKKFLFWKKEVRTKNYIMSTYIMNNVEITCYSPEEYVDSIYTYLKKIADCKTHTKESTRFPEYISNTIEKILGKWNLK
jgi:hypothetical protein